MCVCPPSPPRAEVIVGHHALAVNEVEGINRLPLYPTEALLWDETALPLSDLHSDTMLALPKLNLQVCARARVDMCARVCGCGSVCVRLCVRCVRSCVTECPCVPPLRTHKHTHSS